MKSLTLFEQIVLIAILGLKDDAYGLAIRKRAKQLSGKSIMYGALYNVLDQLFRKGYVTKSKQAPNRAEGGHERIYYRTTSEGLAALKSAYNLQKNVWSSIPEISREFEQ